MKYYSAESVSTYGIYSSTSLVLDIKSFPRIRWLALSSTHIWTCPDDRWLGDGIRWSDGQWTSPDVKSVEFLVW